MAVYHIAQYNIARMRGELDAPIMQGFVSRLDELNHLADRSPGFIWRLRDETDHATSIRVYDDPLIVVNMSTWESIDALHAYAYRSDHGPAYAGATRGSSRWTATRWCSGGCPPATSRRRWKARSA